MLTVSDDHLGTTEQEWLAGDLLERVEPLGWEVGRRVVVVAPHPDDETLGAGGLLHAAHQTGSSILVVFVTDGEASHPGSEVTRGDLAARRRRESEDALGRMGLAGVEVVRCGLPDGRVGRHEPELLDALRGLVDRDDVVLTTWRHDGHPDHDAVGRVGAEVAEAVGARLLELPIWAWHWATPRHGLALASARRRDLSPGELLAKRHAIRAYRSQIDPLGPGAADRAVLPPAVRARFERPFEIFLEPSAT